MLLSRDVASETMTECTMVEREMKARQRAVASILCERAATSLNASLTQDFIAEFCRDIAQDVLRYELIGFAILNATAKFILNCSSVIWNILPADILQCF